MNSKDIFISLPILLKKLKLNVFKDLLRIEFPNGKEFVYVKNLNQIYENIADLDFSQILESSNDEFRQIYSDILSLKNRIKSLGNLKVIITFEGRNINKNDALHGKEVFLCKVCFRK